VIKKQRANQLEHLNHVIGLDELYEPITYLMVVVVVVVVMVMMMGVVVMVGVVLSVVVVVVVVKVVVVGCGVKVIWGRDITRKRDRRR
jgi:hypothetical protein